MALSWQAILDYRDAMAAQGETVLLAPHGGEVGRFIRLLGTPLGAEFMVLGRDGEAGRLWDAVPGDCAHARLGESVLHDTGDGLDVWQVCGRFRRITTGSHPNTPGDLFHVLHQLEGTIG
jgi:hypothetical protein